MKVAVVGLGVQGRKRAAVAGPEVTATVDPVAADAHFKSLEQVPLDLFDAALVCTPDSTKIDLITYLLSRKKHVLVEKPLLSLEDSKLEGLARLAQSGGVVCYTAYNHRFEPHLEAVKRLLDTEAVGAVYLVKLSYGNGTARDVRQSIWRDQGLGVLSDLGSHLLDTVLFLFGKLNLKFEPWSLKRFENTAYDYAVLAAEGRPHFQLEMSLISWKNSFSLDIFGESGSLHVHGLCKWGPSTLTVRKRKLPSGKPEETLETIRSSDPTWEKEYDHFKKICRQGIGNIENDFWINSVLKGVARSPERVETRR